MRFAALLCIPTALGAVPVRAATPRLTPIPRPSSRTLSVPGHLPGLPYLAAPRAPLTDVLPRVQAPFTADTSRPAPDVPPHAAPAARLPGRIQQPLYRPSDIGVFSLQYPLITPDTPVHLSEAEDSQRDSAGIVELPVP